MTTTHSANQGKNYRTDADSTLQIALEQAKGRLSEAEKALQEKAEYAVSATGRQVGRHPWTALAVAGSIGIAVGLLLTRR